MSILHTVNKSPFTHSTLSSCLDVCAQDDGVLLLEDGVFGAITSAPCAAKLQELMARGIKVYAISNDTKARGLTRKLSQNILTTDYAGFVQLTVEHRCVQSWY